MKTEHEIEQMKIEIQERMAIYQEKATTSWHNEEIYCYTQYEREYTKLVAQYNILCEVLR